MIPSPAALARLLRRTPPADAEPKPDTDGAPPAAEEPVPARLGHIETPPEPIRVSPPPEIRPRRTWLNATLSEADKVAEWDVLDRLADRTRALDDPWAAALGMDWEGQ